MLGGDDSRNPDIHQYIVLAQKWLRRYPSHSCGETYIFNHTMLSLDTLTTNIPRLRDLVLSQLVLSHIQYPILTAMML